MKIKKPFVLFSTIFLIFLLFSCKTNDPIQEDTTKLCTTDSVFFTSDKDADLIIIDTKDSWSIVGDQSWVSFSAANGTGKTAILIGSSPNTSFSRKAIVTITASKKTHTIKLSQSGASMISINVNNVSFNLIKIDGGRFTMGESLNNAPAHDVQLTDYYICETEVTNGLWQAVTGSLPYDKFTQWAGNDQRSKLFQPVTAVTWDDITTVFLPAIKTKTGFNFRMPTEAEWEFAAMGGTKSKGYDFAGSNSFDDVGWDQTNSSGVKNDIKLKLPNELGLYDMSGNAGEWCNDWYSNNYLVEVPSVNPKGPTTGTYRIVRGGNYLSAPGVFGSNECKVKQRNYVKPSGYQGIWGDTGNPDEPIIFKCDPIGFRFAISF